MYIYTLLQLFRGCIRVLVNLVVLQLTNCSNIWLHILILWLAIVLTPRQTFSFVAATTVGENTYFFFLREVVSNIIGWIVMNFG